MALAHSTAPSTQRFDTKAPVISKPEKRTKVTAITSLVAGSIAGGVEATITVSGWDKSISLPSHSNSPLVSIRVRQNPSSASDDDTRIGQPLCYHRPHGSRAWHPLHLHRLLDPGTGNRMQGWCALSVLRIHQEYARRRQRFVIRRTRHLCRDDLRSRGERCSRHADGADQDGSVRPIISIFPSTFNTVLTSTACLIESMTPRAAAVAFGAAFTPSHSWSARKA